MNYSIINNKALWEIEQIFHCLELYEKSEKILLYLSKFQQRIFIIIKVGLQFIYFLQV